MRQPSTSRISVWALLAAWLVAYAFIWAIATGDVGFAGDEWRIIGLAARYPLGQALNLSVYEALRPLQGVLPVLTYQVAGLNDTIYNAISALLHAGHVLAFAWAMRRAFPQRSRLIVIASLFIFHLPMLTYLLVNYNYDGVHTAALLYWLSVVAFQHWGGRPAINRLIVPILLYTASLLTYENAFLLFPVTGLLTAAVISQRDRRPWRLNRVLHLITVMIVSHLVGFVLSLGVRSLWQIELHSNLGLLPLNELLNYVPVLIQHLQIPVLPLAPDAIAILIALITALTGLFLVSQAPAPMQEDRPVFKNEGYWLLAVAISLLIFGPLPYILAGYPTRYTFLGQSRYHALALMGVAILIGGAADLLIRHRARIIAYAAIGLWLALASGFLFTFRLQYAQWETIRQSLYRDLLTHVPAVESPALVLIQDGQLITDEMPMLVFGGGHGLQSFLKVFYNTEDVMGGYVISGVDTSEDKTSSTRVSQDGVYASGFTAFEWADLADRVILLRREGEHLVPVESFSASDQVMIVWDDGIKSLETNSNIIRTDQFDAQRQRLIDLGLLKTQ